MLNRLYLLAGLVLSFVIPVLKLSIFQDQSNFVFSRFYEPFLIEPEFTIFSPQNIANEQININYPMILSVIYFSGILFLFLKLLLSIVRIIRIRKNAETFRIGSTKIIKVNSPVPFSYFNLVFLPQNESNPMIIKHELAHIKQLHWLDLVIIEIAVALLWFNPFVVLYKRSLKLQHEYLADSSALGDFQHLESYLTCLLKRVQLVSSGGLVSHFYCKTIKKRIIMITKNKTSVKYFGIYLLVLPLVCLLMFAFTGKNNPVVLNAENSFRVKQGDNQPSIYPVDQKKVTQINGFGEWVHPMSKKKDFHYGIDFAVPEGEEVMVTAPGVVMEARLDTEKGKGNFILVKHNEVYATLYSHLKSISVKTGEKLEKSRVIGFAGNTGKSTGTHLHYEVLKNGERVNPQDYLPK